MNPAWQVACYVGPHSFLSRNVTRFLPLLQPEKARSVVTYHEQVRTGPFTLEGIKMGGS
jgi:hypothetical protein